MPPANSSSSPNEADASTPTATATTTTATNGGGGGDNNNALQDAALAASVVGGSIIAFKALAATLAATLTLSVSLLPLAYAYGLHTCPPVSSFDAKARLRSVLRGDDLPDGHPRKPPNGGTAAATKTTTWRGLWKDAVAALRGELATFPGYEVAVADAFGGAARIVTVTLPGADLKCTWIGCNHKWYFWGSSKISGNNNNNSNGNSTGTQ